MDKNEVLESIHKLNPDQQTVIREAMDAMVLRKSPMVIMAIFMRWMDGKVNAVPKDADRAARDEAKKRLQAELDQVKAVFDEFRTMRPTDIQDIAFALDAEEKDP